VPKIILIKSFNFCSLSIFRYLFYFFELIACNGDFILRGIVTSNLK